LLSGRQDPTNGYGGSGKKHLEEVGEAGERMFYNSLGRETWDLRGERGTEIPNQAKGERVLRRNRGDEKKRGGLELNTTGVFRSTCHSQGGEFNER